MKTIYLVRHGESTSNVSNVVQSSEDVLTPAGERQAEILAERLSKLSFQNLIVSDFVRTKQTVAPLLKRINTEPKYSELLREARRPSSLVGSSLSGDGFAVYERESKTHVLDSEWHFEDEENYFDIIERIKKLFVLVDGLEGDTVLISHGRFTVYLVMYVILGGKITPDVWNTDFDTFTTTNTGITVLSYKDSKNNWALTTYNDHAHFAE
jgi:broad specificity phosphatase PhoE